MTNVPAHPAPPPRPNRPLFGSWPRAYAVVMLFLLVEIAFFYGLMRWFA